MFLASVSSVQRIAGAWQVQINRPHMESVFWRTCQINKVYTFLIIVKPLNGLMKSAILLSLIYRHEYCLNDLRMA